MRWHTFKTSIFFHQFLFLIKTFQDSRLFKYLINKELMTFSDKIQAKTFTWPDMSFYARQLTLMRQTNESNKRAPGRVVIYISVHSVSIYTLTFNTRLALFYSLIIHCISFVYSSLPRPLFLIMWLETVI